jgi:pimeloyl-ACP methyl ester carboxylesterase
MANPLAHAIVRDDNVEPTRWVFFLHGILGSGANWRTFAKRVIAANPGLGAVLVDLPMHGASLDLPPPHTITSAASDVLALIGSFEGKTAGIIAHSFGGKVALEMLRIAPVQAFGEVYILDSTPGPRPDAHGSEDTLHVVDVLESVPFPLATRAAFSQHLCAAGISEPTTAWLAMNLRASDAGFVYKLDLEVIQTMLDDYFDRDLWPVIESPPINTNLHLVLGGKSEVFRKSERDRALDTASKAGARVTVDVLPNAGHWVHVDDPDGLFAVLKF